MSHQSTKNDAIVANVAQTPEERDVMRPYPGSVGMEHVHMRIHTDGNGGGQGTSGSADTLTYLTELAPKRHADGMTVNYANLLRDIMTRLHIDRQEDLAKQLDVTQATVSRWMKGSKPRLEHYDRILDEARRLGLPLPGLGENSYSNNVPVVGHVGAGGEVLFDLGQGPFGTMEAPPEGGGPDTVAVVVRGESMTGILDDGWAVYYNRRHDRPTPDMLGKLCVVGLEDGRVLVKRLLKGRVSGGYDLYSVAAAPLLDQVVTWAAKVIWIKPT